jgi:hypothetical protein
MMVIITRSDGSQVPIPRDQLDTGKFRLSHSKNGTPVYVLKERAERPGLRVVSDDSDKIPG